MSDRFGYGEIGLGNESDENDKKTTNADRIRAMSDEELADFLLHICDWSWLEWLKGEVQDG